MLQPQLKQLKAQLFEDSVQIDRHTRAIDPRIISDSESRLCLTGNGFTDSYSQLVNGLTSYVCDLIRSQYPTMPERVLEYTVFTERGGLESREREIDLIIGEDQEPRCFLELKASADLTGREQEARRQIETSIRIGSLKWPNIKGAIILIDLSVLMDPRFVTSPSPVESTHKALRKLLDSHHNNHSIGSKVIYADKIWSHLAESQGWDEKFRQSAISALLEITEETARRRIEIDLPQF